MTRSFPPSIPSDDRGFLLGDAVFETVGVRNGSAFRLDRHLGRLRAGAALVGISVPPHLEASVQEALDRVAGDATLRITLSRGSGGGLVPDAGLESRLVVAVRPPTPPAPPEGIRVAVHGRIDEEALTAGLKASGYLERIQALRLAKEEGCDDVLLRNTRGRVVEGAASNLFALVEGRLLAPGPQEGALPGITREAVLESAPHLGLVVEERGVSASELSRASELMLSSAGRGLVPVVAVRGEPVGDGVPGPVFGRLRESLDRLWAEESSADSQSGQPSS